MLMKGCTRKVYQALKRERKALARVGIAFFFAFFLLVDEQDTGTGTKICTYQHSGSGAIIVKTIPATQVCRTSIRAS